MKKIIFGLLMLSCVSVAKADLITSTLLDHVAVVTQFGNGSTNLALVDSVFQIGNVNGASILDIQGGFATDVAPNPGEEKDFLIAGGFFKVSSFLKGHLHTPAHWDFLNSLEHGPAAFYNFKERDWQVSYQVGLAFDLNPKP